MLRRHRRTPHRREHPVGVARSRPRRAAAAAGGRGGGGGHAIAYAALTLAATSSEAVCMAIGQIWSSALAADAARSERAEGERAFHLDRARSKARLVDALMVSGGMLKIDAVSLAETLEGYPDLFVSALLGGGICSEEEEEEEGEEGGGGGRDGVSEEEDGDSRYRYSSLGRGGDAVAGGGDPPWYGGVDVDVVGGGGSDDPYRPGTSAKASSPPDESGRTEALLTMLGFVASSLIPSLTYCCAQLVLDRAYGADDRAATAAPAPLGRGASPASAASLCASAITMFALGAWKSRFYHPSHWSSFALKNVGVLAICVATAYSVGYACRVAINAGPFVPDEGDRGLWHAE